MCPGSCNFAKWLPHPTGAQQLYEPFIGVPNDSVDQEMEGFRCQSSASQLLDVGRKCPGAGAGLLGPHSHLKPCGTLTSILSLGGPSSPSTLSPGRASTLSSEDPCPQP